MRKEKEFICVPKKIIMNDKLDYRRVATMTYLLSKVGRDGTLILSVNAIVRWLGYTPKSGENNIANKIKTLLFEFKRMKYITFNEDDIINCGSYFVVTVSEDIYSLIGSNPKRLSYVLLYIDEIEKIINFVPTNEKCKYNNKAFLLLYICYLKDKIWVRYAGHDNPETFRTNFEDIANELSVCCASVKKASKTLCFLKLIYYKTLRYDLDGWKSAGTVFTRYYKRGRDGYSVRGSSYFDKEFELELDRYRDFILKNVSDDAKNFTYVDKNNLLLWQ